MKNRVGLNFKKNNRFRLSNTRYLTRAYEEVGNGLGTGDIMINNASLNTVSKLLNQILKSSPFEG